VGPKIWFFHDMYTQNEKQKKSKPKIQIPIGNLRTKIQIPKGKTQKEKEKEKMYILYDVCGLCTVIKYIPILHFDDN